MTIVTEVHIPQIGYPAIGIVSDLDASTYVVLHHDGDRWEIMGASHFQQTSFHAPMPSDRQAWKSLPTHIEGELNRRLTAARTRATVSGTYATASYESLGQIVDVEA